MPYNFSYPGVYSSTPTKGVSLDSDQRSAQRRLVLSAWTTGAGLDRAVHHRHIHLRRWHMRTPIHQYFQPRMERYTELLPESQVIEGSKSKQLYQSRSRHRSSVDVLLQWTYYLRKDDGFELSLCNSSRCRDEGMPRSIRALLESNIARKHHLCASWEYGRTLSNNVHRCNLRTSRRGSTRGDQYSRHFKHHRTSGELKHDNCRW